MDMQDKLFPIFIKETAKNLNVLQDFLQAGAVAPNTPQQMEAAFRAAHTLKGTARLVKVDSVHQIGRRIEALLEKHLSAKTRPTPVEREAMGLAVGWLEHLVVDLQAGRPGSSSLVADAISALDLAVRFPGDTPLVELLDSALQQRAPHLSDPFSGDPELLLDEEEILRIAKDPFADDPGFGFGFNFLSDPADQLPKPASFTGNEPSAPAEGSAAAPADGILQSEAAVASNTEVPFDPFAEDLSFLETDEFLPEVAIEGSSNPPQTENPTLDAPVDVADPAELSSETPAPSTALPVDPFADDDYLEEDFDALTPLDVAPVAVADNSTELVKNAADGLLLPNEAVGPEHLYVCCCFELASHKYYLPIEFVLEIAETPPLLPLPLAPAPISGLVNLRGQVLPVVDLSSLAEQPQTSAGVRRLVVVEHQQEKLAFLADGIPYLSEAFVGDRIDLPGFIQRHSLKGAEE